MNTAVKSRESSQKSLFSSRELSVIRALFDLTGPGKEPTLDLSEISFSCGVRDQDEVLRSLYTLEGKALVEPDPPGDFTSTRWRITDVGRKAVSTLGL